MENKTEYTPQKIAELRALADRTMFRLQETITGDRKITMHIPARPNDDLDLLVGETKHQLKEALTEIERLQADSSMTPEYERGASAMREAAAKKCEDAYNTYRGYDSSGAYDTAVCDCAGAIRAIDPASLEGTKK